MARMRINDREIEDADVFEIIVEHFPDIIHSVDREGNIVFTNRKAGHMLGYSRDELLSMNVKQIYADEILEQMEKGFSELKEKGEKQTIESLLKDRDGENIPVEIRSYSIYDDDNNFVRTFSILRDIRDIKELQNSLIHAGRLAAIGEMASGIAHDIKSPLNALLLANQGALLTLDNMPTKTKEIEQIERSLKGMKKALEMIRNLSEHLTNFSRGMTEQFELVDIYSVISDSLFITHNKILKCGVDLENNIQKGAYFTKGAFNQLEQVFVNLISNACDAMAETKGGSLSLAISPYKSNGSEYWKCEVSDTGHGIPEKDRNMIFQSFYTTKERGKGTGLGLSISRGIIENHEGKIAVQSEEGRGTTFSVFLKSSG
ncbi:MAG: PAS domain S-box protein [Deltaproteobacteria bacterium]|nr:PAS domain S-box protein [Deltaproteobacteria bacterium]